MKSLKEKLLHIADFKWHLPFIVAVCFNLFNYILMFLVEDFEWLSSSQINNWGIIFLCINIFMLILLIILIIYQLIKRRWIRAFITTIYSALHSGVSYYLFLGLVILLWQRGCSESITPCKCKNAKEGWWMSENCKDYIESLSEDAKNKWIEDQKKCEKSDENNNIDINYTVEFKTDSTFLIRFNHKGETKTQLITYKFDEMYYPEDKEGYLMRRLTYDDWSFDGILDLSIACMHRSGSGGTIYDIWIFNKDIGQFEYENYLSNTFIEKDDETKTVRQYYRMGVDGRGEEISSIDTFYSGNKIYNSTFEKFKEDFID